MFVIDKFISKKEYLKDVLPFEKKSLFFVEISSVMNIVFYSTLITAIFEGTLFAIIAMIYGFNGLLFGILYGFASLIPVVGGLLLWLPLSLYHYSTGDSFGAVMIASYSVLVISLIADTFIKPFIIEYVNEKAVTTPSNISSLVIFFAMLAGLTTFGFWGVIVGPAITTFFISFATIFACLSLIISDESYSKERYGVINLSTKFLGFGS